MKRKKKLIVPAAVLAGTAVSGGLHVLNINQAITNEPYSVMAYTSAVNNQDPATAPEGHEVNIPDAKLRAALNEIIAKEMNNKRKLQGLPQDVVRTPNQKITAGEMKLPVDVFGDKTLNGKGITNAEGIQFLVNATHIDINKNQITNVAPFRDLSKLTILNIESNRLTNDSLQVFAAMPALKSINVANNQDLTDLSPITNRKDWTTLYIGLLKFDDLTALSGMNNLKHLAINSLKTSRKLDLAPLASLQELTSLNINYQSVALTEDDMRAVKDLPKLTKVNTAGNSISNLQSLFTDGFAALDKGSTFTDQKITITLSKWQREFDNPIKTIDGSVVPIVETANVKNKGNKIELVGLNNKGSVDVSWDTTFNRGKLTNTKFGGKLTVKYDLSDSNLPVFNPLQPAKIVSRKGVAITINDVTASDAESGLSADGVTHNAAAINLDPSNPAKGNYELTYSAQDNAGNTATVNRSIEITDADALQQKVDSVGGNFLEGYTLDTKNAVVTAQRQAEGIIAANGSTQDQINEALRDLDKAIKDLRANRQAIEQATSQYNREPEYVQHDPAVSAALQHANNIYNLPTPGPTPAQVKQAAESLTQAMENAKQAEAARRTAARQALDKAEQDQTASAIADAKTKIAALKDKDARQSMERELAPIERDYDNAKKALEDIIARAEDPKTTENANNATKQALADQVRLAKALFNSDPSQTDFENMKNDVEQKINELRPDTAALEAVINSVSSESAFVQQDAEVVKKLAAANSVKNNPASTIQQITTAKSELEKAIADARAVEAEQKAEAQRQTEAEAAVVAAEAAKTPDAFSGAQAKIDAVKADAVKQEMQNRLDVVKQAYQAKKDELKALIDKAQLPETTDGMTKATANALKAELANAQATYVLSNLPQSSIETAIGDLKSALDALLTDKTPLVAAEDFYNDQPDYIKNNPAVSAAFRKAQGTRSMPNPPVKNARSDAKALENAILTAVQQELNSQKDASNELKAATEKLAAQMNKWELPDINIAELEAKVGAIQDPVKKTEFMTLLNKVKADFAARKKQVDDYLKTEEGKKKLQEQKTPKSQPKSPKSPNSGYQKQSNIGFLAAVVSLPITVLTFAVKKIKRQ